MTTDRRRTLGFIGAGNMAAAIAQGVMRAGLFPADAIIAADPAEDRRHLFAGWGCRTTASNAEASAIADLAVLAVKPQTADAVLEELKNARPRASVLWVSIMAGVPAKRIEAKLGGGPRVVRAMPNTPMLAGEGATAVAPGSSATAKDVDDAAALFESCGVVERVSEKDMDAVTALSGSGPGYFMYLIEAMVEAAAAEGMDRKTALRLAAATCRGSGRLLETTGESPEALRARVTSKGGTTAAAISALDQAGVKDALVRAVRAAAARSRELGR
jgi:pyrroline-5-carboxylate reductase